jgi:hypothetical protein
MTPLALILIGTSFSHPISLSPHFHIPLISLSFPFHTSFSISTTTYYYYKIIILSSLTLHFFTLRPHSIGLIMKEIYNVVITCSLPKLRKTNTSMIENSCFCESAIFYYYSVNLRISLTTKLKYNSIALKIWKSNEDTAMTIFTC